MGDADRFCILLTKEQGRLAAIARGVRKPKSRLGGSLLPLQHITVNLSESSAGFAVTDANITASYSDDLTIAQYVCLQHACEILLAIIEDHEPVPKIYELTTEFFALCAKQTEPSILPFMIKLLNELGVLPKQSNHQVFDHLEAAEKEFLEHCLKASVKEIPMESNHLELKSLCDRILEDQCRHALKVPNVMQNVI